MARPKVHGVAPFFIVRDVSVSIAFYKDALGFEVMYRHPEQGPFFAVVNRDGAMLMLKAIGEEPMPNSARHADARWDAYFNVPDPDALAAEFAAHGVVFSVPLRETHEGLRGFEVKDADGYVLFFGRPR